MLKEISTINRRLHLLLGGEMIVLAIHLETPGRSGSVRYREAKLVGVLVEKLAQQRRLTGARRATDHQ